MMKKAAAVALAGSMVLSMAACGSKSDGRGGSSESAAAAADGKAVICFQNTVQNAADFDAGRMFDRFYTGDKSRHDESTGLGLAVVKTLAEKLDGQVSAAIEADLFTIKVVL